MNDFLKPLALDSSWFFHARPDRNRAAADDVDFAKFRGQDARRIFSPSVEKVALGNAGLRARACSLFDPRDWITVA